jgi:hypothetical protein
MQVTMEKLNQAWFTLHKPPLKTPGHLDVKRLAQCEAASKRN